MYTIPNTFNYKIDLENKKIYYKNELLLTNDGNVVIKIDNYNISQEVHGLLIRKQSSDPWPDKITAAKNKPKLVDIEDVHNNIIYPRLTLNKASKLINCDAKTIIKYCGSIYKIYKIMMSS